MVGRNKLNKQEILEQIESIVKKGFEYRKDTRCLTMIEVFGKDRMPLWTFKMLAELFEFFIVNGVTVKFTDMIAIDSISAGHIDYDRQIIHCATDNFWKRANSLGAKKAI